MGKVSNACSTSLAIEKASSLCKLDLKFRGYRASTFNFPQLLVTHSHRVSSANCPKRKYGCHSLLVKVPNHDRSLTDVSLSVLLDNLRGDFYSLSCHFFFLAKDAMRFSSELLRHLRSKLSSVAHILLCYVFVTPEFRLQFYTI